MTVYHEHGVHLSEAQRKALAKGMTVKMKHEQLAGEHTLHLTATQIARIKKAQAAGKGCTLKLSAAQIRHHAVSGGSLSDILKSVKTGAMSLAHKGVDKGLDIADDFARKKLGDSGLYSAAAPLVKKGVGWALNKLIDTVGQKFGAGLRDHVHHHIVGSGIFGDIMGGLGSVLNSPIGQFGTNFLARKLGGGFTHTAHKFIHKEYHAMLKHLAHAHGPHIAAHVDHHIHGLGIFGDIMCERGTLRSLWEESNGTVVCIASNSTHTNGGSTRVRTEQRVAMRRHIAARVRRTNLRTAHTRTGVRRVAGEGREKRRAMRVGRGDGRKDRD